MDLFLLLISAFALIFGVYWYFIHIPNYYGYVSKNGAGLKVYLKPDKLNELVQNPDPNIWILDVREREYFLLGHIPTAKSFPHDEVEQWYTQIPKDKSLILYCDLSLKTQNVIAFLEQKGYSRMMNWGKFKRWHFEVVIEESVSY